MLKTQKSYSIYINMYIMYYLYLLYVYLLSAQPCGIGLPRAFANSIFPTAALDVAISNNI